MLRALKSSHASFVGYHGWAEVYLRENKDFAKSLLNRMGYWFFPHNITLPVVAQLGAEVTMDISVENRGVAPSYKKYLLKVRLKGNGMVRDIPVESIDVRNWIEGKTVSESHRFKLSSDLEPGKYAFSIGLFRGDEPVQLALKTSLRDSEFFYQVGEIEVRK